MLRFLMSICIASHFLSHVCQQIKKRYEINELIKARKTLVVNNFILANSRKSDAVSLKCLLCVQQVLVAFKDTRAREGRGKTEGGRMG